MQADVDPNEGRKGRLQQIVFACMFEHINNAKM